MKYKRPSITDVIEAFLTGLSCLIGGDQFYIFISQTNASIKTQYCILVTFSVFVFMSSIMLDHINDIILNGYYLIYVILTGILALISYNRVKSSFFVSLMTISISIVLTFFIIQACAKYTNKKFLLPSFIIGLFASRLIPNLCWILMRKRFDDFESQQYSVSLIVSIFRFSMGLKVILIKVITRNFNIDYKSTCDYSFGMDKFPKFEAFNTFFRIILKVRLSLFPYVFFISSVVLCLTFPPTIYISYFTYSSQLASALSTLEMAIHLLGLGMGAIVPFSSTSNYYHYYSIVFVIYIAYFCNLGIIYHLGKFFSHYVLYIMVIISSFILGYLCTYSLTILINTTFLKTCKYEEYKNKPCCGEKINSKCYCQYPLISDSNKDVDVKRFNCSGMIYSEKKNIPKYGSDGTHAIVIITDESLCKDLPDCKTPCGGAGTCCQSNNQECCLCLVGVYLLESTTTSSCEDCQLTVRLESKLVCYNKSCSSNSGSQCTCPTGGSTGKCCCLCVKCCQTSCSGQCSCARLCSCTQPSKCLCKKKPNYHVRIFIAYKNGGEKCCCIKEIKPNLSLDFKGDKNGIGDFDIRDLFISDCCHNDLIVDIYCTMKNNFYRLTGIDYSKKVSKLKSISLSRKDGECCKKEPQTQCCCADSQLVILCVTYDPPLYQDKKEECACGGSCKKTCQCCNHLSTGKCCCCVPSNIPVDSISSFYKKVDSSAIKLVCGSMFYISLFSLLMVLLVFWIRSRNIPPYKFSPKTTFDKIKKVSSKKKFNIDSEIKARLINIAETPKANHFKEEDVANMLTLMSKVMKNDNYEKLKKHVNKNSEKFIKKSNVDKNLKKPEIVKWCYCTGLFYGYFRDIFKGIQKFFAYWEKAWQNEFFDYRKLLSSLINGISQKSKFSISVMTELNVAEMEVYKTSKDRTSTWTDVFGELDKYTDLYEGELKFSSSWLPFRLDHRMTQYRERWKHRLGHIYEWTRDDKSVFDWKPFLYYFSRFEDWYKDFYPYLVRFSDNVKIPPKSLNKETSVFVNYKLK